ncbi:MAG: pyridoxamine 5'-phosphate oxidase [Rhodospirillaceae bacterium]|nr:pyridoxamine 5'-phosphate oxidase [Rhodospirillaceae bacterium]
MSIEPTAEPIDLFQAWFAEARESEPNDANAMALASVGADGMPSVRMVLLKDADADGFVFYTNFESRKGTELLAHPQAALCFHWKSLRRQVRVEGAVGTVTDAEADAYFASRARGSQIGAWASQQSRPMTGKAELLKRVGAFTAKFAVGKVARPPHWSGFRLMPRGFEFWNDGQFRLHDRLVYRREGDGWRTEVLYP